MGRDVHIDACFFGGGGVHIEKEFVQEQHGIVQGITVANNVEDGTPLNKPHIFWVLNFVFHGADMKCNKARFRQEKQFQIGLHSNRQSRGECRTRLQAHAMYLASHLMCAGSR